MYHFRRLLTKEQIFTIPNFMSFFRLVLVPFIIWTYLKDEYDLAATLVVVSALTDIFDGVIARKFDMISDFGKVLDPVCDKVTHAALLISLGTRYWYVWIVFAILAVKELSMLGVGALAVRRSQTVHSAKWYGKFCTVVFELSMIVLMLFPDIPERCVIGILGLCALVLLFSFVMYMIFFLRLILIKKGG